MPFVKWCIQPVQLNSSAKDKNLKHELETISNNALVGTLRQLACLVQLAHHVFSEISTECQEVYNRSENLRFKIQECQDNAQSLNPKTVPIPVGDLSKVSQLKTYYRTSYGLETSLFVHETRPSSVQKLYSFAVANPVPIIRSIDQYRTDGRTGSKLFMCMPVFGDAKARNLSLEIETRKPTYFSIARDGVESRGSSQQTDPDLLLSDDESIVNSDSYSDFIRLPSPEERMLALSMEYPSSVVPIDVREANFNRMSTFRRSLIHVDFFIRRKKKKQKDKRRNTISEGDSKELQAALKKAGVCEQEYVHNSSQTENNISETKIEQSNFLQKLEKRVNRQNSSPKKNNKKDHRELYETVDLKVSKDWKPGRKGKSSEDNQVILKKKQDSDVIDSKTSSVKNKGRSYIPISTLSAAMTVAVKMRQTFSSTKEDGQSSSGNWSATSSTRASVNSDQQHKVSSRGVRSPSESSISKDSVLSDNTQQNISNRQHDSGTGYTSDATTMSSRWRPSSLVARQFTALDTETWLQSVEPESSDMTDNYHSDSTGTPRLHSAMDDEDSSVFSVDTDGYFTSMHTDSGLKGLHANKNYDSSEEENYGMGPRQGSDTSISTVGNSSLNSLLSRTATELSSSCSTLTYTKKAPPPPPPRISSIKTKIDSTQRTKDDTNTKTTRSCSAQLVSHTLVSNSEMSASESEDGLLKKTSINSDRYPALCPVSLPESDNESCRSGYSQDGKTIKGKLSSIMNKKTFNKSQKEAFGNEHYYNKDQASIKKLSFDMYGDQSPQKAKFTTAIQQKGSPPLGDRKSSMTSFYNQDQNDGKNMTSFVSTSFLPQSPTEGSQSPGTSSRSSTIVGSPTSQESVIITDPAAQQDLPTVKKQTPVVPLKYVHHITVKPVVRQAKMENLAVYNPSTVNRQETSNSDSVHEFPEKQTNANVKEYSHNTSGKFNSSSQSPTYYENISFISTNSPVQDSSVSTNQTNSTDTKPLRPTTLIPASANRPVARVTLDPNGQVIFCSNSLGRKRDGFNMNNSSLHPVNHQEIKFATLPLRQTSSPQEMYHSLNAKSYANPRQPSPNVIDAKTKAVYCSDVPVSQPFTPPSPSNQKPCNGYINQDYILYQNKPELHNYQKMPYFNHVRATVPSVQNISPISHSVTSLFTKSPAMQNFAKLSPSPVPLLTTQNLNLHSQRMNSMHTLPSHYRVSDISPASSSEKITSAILTSTPISSNNTSPESSSHEVKKKSMTTEDLFTIIHSSKKKHNIKTDSDISISPLSSRSSSPSVGRPITPNRSVMVETGFLSPRSINQGTPRDRRSWSGDIKTLARTPGERRSLACDRLGPGKRTSMHDFKMLLLQTRSSSSTVQNGSSRVSAVEQLKASAPPARIEQLPNGLLSPPGVQSVPCSPTNATDSLLYNGHSTVPLKRSCRARASLQCRYAMYPPIYEDCSEESETHHEVQCSPKNKHIYPKNSNCINSLSSSNTFFSSHQNHSSQLNNGSLYHGHRGASSTWV